MDENNTLNRIIFFFRQNIEIIQDYYAYNNIKELWDTIIQISFIKINEHASILDWKRYLSHGDLVKAGLTKPVDACWHYLTYGRKERRKVFKFNSNEPYIYNFDWKMYLNLNRDIFTLTEIETFTHWLEKGQFENRQTTEKRSEEGKIKYKLNESLMICDNEKNNNIWKHLILSIIQENNINIEDILYDNIFHLLKIPVPNLRSKLNNYDKHKKLYYKLLLQPNMSLTMYLKQKEIFNLNTKNKSVNYSFENIDDTIKQTNTTIFIYMIQRIYVIFLNENYVTSINDYDDIKLESEYNYAMSINYPLSVENFDKTNWENLNYLFGTLFPRTRKKYQLNICHIDPLLSTNIDNTIENLNCNYIYVEKPLEFNFNLGYLRNLYKYLSLSYNIMFSDIDIPITNNILNNMVNKLNNENYHVVKPYTNNIIYTNPKQKADWLNNYEFHDDNNFNKFISTLVNTTNKQLFTTSGGIVAFKKKIIDKIGGFSEINGFGFEDRFMDVHLLNTPNLRIFKFNNKLFHLYHNMNHKKKELPIHSVLKLEYNRKFYNCYWQNGMKDDIHECCYHTTKYLHRIEQFHRKNNGKLCLFKDNHFSNKYLTLKEIPF